MTIADIRRLYSEERVRPAEVVESYLNRIEEKDPAIGAFLHIFKEKAIEEAETLDIALMESKPLFGVPIALKDNICTKGKPTTCASRILEGYVPPYDATVVERLKEAGAVIIGKTNMDEFAMGSSTENSAFQLTHNPWDTDYAPGGSSGGSAAAVAAGMVPVALGSDTGGSIRQPASLCGVVGMKGTYGRVSRYGLVAFASSFDQIGPIGKNVRDTAFLMDVVSGHDPHDSTSIQESHSSLVEALEEEIGDLTFSVPRGFRDLDLSPSVREALGETVEYLRNSGREVREVELPDLEAAMACYYILADAEASSNLARYDGVRYGYRHRADSLIEMYEKTRGEGFGEEVKRRILTGTYVLSSGYYDEYYSRAQKVRAMIIEDFRRVFSEVDVVITPTSPTPAFKLGEKVDNPIAMYLSDIFTTTANIAGIPAISIPARLSPEGLPIGIQVMAGLKEERKMIRAAYALEKEFDFQSKVSGPEVG